MNGTMGFVVGIMYQTAALRDSSIKIALWRLCPVVSAEYGLIISQSRCDKAPKQIIRGWLLTAPLPSPS